MPPYFQCALMDFSRNTFFVLLLAIFFLPNSPERGCADENSASIVFYTKSWEGEYSTTDVANGVKYSPNTDTLYTVQADGTNLRKIIDQPGAFPYYSPDGRWIYFQSNAEGPWNIYRCLEDGSQLFNLTASHQLGVDSYGSQISRDGQRIVFAAHDGTIARVALMNPDGSEPRILAPRLGHCYMAAISPDGEQVVLSHTDKGYRMLSTNSSGENVVYLTQGTPRSFSPQFAADGTTIVFPREDGDIYRANVDGKNLKRLTQGNNYFRLHIAPGDAHGASDFPNVSWDGKKIAYAAMKESIPQVYTMNLDGSDQRQITHRKSPCGWVRWSPDGEQLAFVSLEGNYLQIFVIDAKDPREPKQITNLEGTVCALSWKP